MQQWRYVGWITLACFGSACAPKRETVEQCARRFTKLSDDMPVSAGPVHGSYMYDLARMDRERVNRLISDGVGGHRPPMVVYATRDTRRSLRAFGTAPVERDVIVFLAQSTVLLRAASGVQTSAKAAIETGCKLLPGARLEHVALTAARTR